MNNWQQYLINYPDVVSVFGNTKVGALKHYKRFGKNEGRTDKPLFMKVVELVVEKFDKPVFVEQVDEHLVEHVDEQVTEQVDEPVSVEQIVEQVPEHVHEPVSVEQVTEHLVEQVDEPVILK